MKNIFFIRHGKLDLPYKDHSQMPSSLLNDLGKKTLDPNLDFDYISKDLSEDLSKIIPLEKIGKIYVSPFRRCRETGRFIAEFIQKNYDQKIEIEVREDLREVYFELENILANKKSADISGLNNAVLEAIYYGKNAESLDKICERLNNFFDILSNLEVNTLVISHDFLMRFIELILLNKGKIQTSDILLAGLLNTKRNVYLRGFFTDNNFLDIQNF